MHIETYTGDAAEWDSFIRRHEGWTYAHRFDWKTVTERVFGHETLPFVARNEAEQIEGVLLLVRVKSLLFGHYLVSMPFLNYGGPLGSDDATRALVEHAVEVARGDRVKLLELRSRTPLSIPLPASHRKVTVVLDLPAGDSETLWKRLTAKVRSQVRRPQKEGITVRFGLDQLPGFFEVFHRHMRDLGTPTQPRVFFETIAETFPDDTWFGCAYHQGRPVAAGCGFRWANEFEMTWASALRSYNRLAPNMLLYWSFMERAAQEGLSIFNFGRCSPGGSTHRFKHQWGSRDEQLWWYQHSDSGVTGTPAPDRGPYAWGPRIWRRLPTPIATALGPRIARYIP